MASFKVIVKTIKLLVKKYFFSSENVFHKENRGKYDPCKKYEMSFLERNEPSIHLFCKIQLKYILLAQK